jgi:hypothetical protein
VLRRKHDQPGCQPTLLPLLCRGASNDPASMTSLARTSVYLPYTDARTWLNLVMKACLSQSTSISEMITNSTG